MTNARRRFELFALERLAWRLQSWNEPEGFPVVCAECAECHRVSISSGTPSGNGKEDVCLKFIFYLNKSWVSVHYAIIGSKIQTKSYKAYYLW